MRLHLTLPANQADRAGPKLVHQDPKWQCGGTEQEGANGETQIQHLLLVHTGKPLLDHAGRGRINKGHNQGIVHCGNTFEGEC